MNKDQDNKTFSRRNFLTGTAAAAAAVAAAPISSFNAVPDTVKPFKAKYAPHFGMFKENAGADFLDQLLHGASPRV